MFPGPAFFSASAPAVTDDWPLSLGGVQRKWLIDPHITSRLTLDGSNRVSAIAEATGLANYNFTQSTAGLRPSVSTVRTRRVFDFDATPNVEMAGGSAFVTDLQNLGGPRTLVFVYITPSAFPTNVYKPLLAGYSTSSTTLNRNQVWFFWTFEGKLEMYGERVANVSSPQYSEIMSAQTVATDGRYMLVVRHNANGLQDFFFNTSKIPHANNPSATGVTATGLNGVVLGDYDNSGSTDTPAGKLGAFMSYDGEVSDTEITTTLWNKVQALYP